MGLCSRWNTCHWFNKSLTFAKAIASFQMPWGSKGCQKAFLRRVRWWVRFYLGLLCATYGGRLFDSWGPWCWPVANILGQCADIHDGRTLDQWESDASVTSVVPCLYQSIVCIQKCAMILGITCFLGINVTKSEIWLPHCATPPAHEKGNQQNVLGSVPQPKTKASVGRFQHNTKVGWTRNCVKMSALVGCPDNVPTMTKKRTANQISWQTTVCWI